MDNTADVTFSGGVGSDALGRSVSSGGYVDGDGYADVIVGADGADAGGTDKGQAYIYYGGSSMDDTADVTFSGAADNDYLGYSVSAGKSEDGYSSTLEFFSPKSLDDIFDYFSKKNKMENRVDLNSKQKEILEKNLEQDFFKDWEGCYLSFTFNGYDDSKDTDCSVKFLLGTDDKWIWYVGHSSLGQTFNGVMYKNNAFEFLVDKEEAKSMFTYKRWF